MRRITACFPAITMLFSLVACEEEQSQTRYDPIVVWASYADEEYLPDFLAGFTAETGIPVTVVHADSNSHTYNLIQNIGAQPPDVFMTRNIANLWFAADEGALRPIRAENINSVADALKDSDDLWTAINYQESAIAYLADSTTDRPLDFSALADKAFDNRLCMSSSRLAINQQMIAMMIEDVGTRAAEQQVRNWISNLAHPPFDSEQELLDAIEAGKCQFGILSGWGGSLLFSNTDATIELFRPRLGYTQVEGVGVGRHSRYPESAHQLVNWLLAKKTNLRHAQRSNAYSVTDDSHRNIDGQPAGVAGWRYDDAKLLIERAGYP